MPMAGSRAAIWSGLRCKACSPIAGRIDILVIYKVDRLTQSLANFARLVEIFDAQDATFVPLRSSSIRRARCGAPHAQYVALH
jgi:hypothetical protein